MLPSPADKARPCRTAYRLLAAFLLALSVQHAPALAQGRARFSLGAGIHHSTGRYGASTSTEVLYVPLTARYGGVTGYLSLTAPYIAIRGRGEPVSGGVVFDAEGDKEVAASGLGDVIASGGLTILRGAEPWPWVDLAAIVKFGTADPEQQLGTGENDYALQADAYQRVGGWNWFATVGHKWPGSPDSIHFRNVFYGLAGASRPLTSAIRAGMMYSGQQPLTEGTDPQGDLAVFAAWTLSPAYSLQGYFSGGLTRASPERAAGVTLIRTW
jgi:hypothetical protein